MTLGGARVEWAGAVPTSCPCARECLLRPRTAESGAHRPIRLG